MFAYLLPNIIFSEPISKTELIIFQETNSERLETDPLKGVIFF
jgi:hypothetical protein